MTYFFTADEHYGHANIIKYCKRPFKNKEQMGKILINRHNEVVTNSDTVVHAGDFTLGNYSFAQEIIKQLNGKHIFLRGSHDRWLPSSHVHEILDLTVNNQPIVICHYAMRVWHRSHYNSWQLYGHSHGMLEPVGKQWDVGVDINNFYPVSFNELKVIMEARPDNPNLIKK